MSSPDSHASADQDSRQTQCICGICKITTEEIGPCRVEKHAKEHVADVVELIKNSQTTTLVVGPSMVKISCHTILLTILLSYYSAFFDEALYGNSKNASQKSLDLPDFDAEEISSFTSWLRSGRIDRRMRPARDDTLWSCSLWILGSKLVAPSFSNRALERLCDSYGKNYFIDTPETELAYKHTRFGSNPRLFIAELIRLKGPFSEDVANRFDEKYPNKWMELLRKGRDLICKVITTGLINYESELSPWQNGNIKKHYEDELLRCSAESWHNEKLLVDRSRREGFVGYEEERNWKNQERPSTEEIDPTGLADTEEQKDGPDNKRARISGITPTPSL